MIITTVCLVKYTDEERELFWTKWNLETFNNQRSKKNRNNEWLAPESNLEKAKFDYEGGMKTEYFNIRVNLLAEYMANLMKHNGPQ